MYVAVLPRKVVGVIFCFCGGLVMIGGILGDSRNGGPVVSIALGALFVGLGWLTIKSSKSTSRVSLDKQRRATREPDNSGPNQLASVQQAKQQPFATAVEAPHKASAPDQMPLAQTPSAAAEVMAKLIGNAFSSARYLELFANEPFSNQWTINDGLAVWYFFGTMALDIAAYTTIESAANTFAGMVDKFLSKEWRMSQGVLARFNETRQRTAEVAFSAFMDCKSGSDYFTYSSRCVNRILGQELPFHGATVDLILKGFTPGTLDSALLEAYFKLFSEATLAAKQAIRESKIDWASLSHRPSKPIPQEGSDYPTQIQMQEMWDALESDDDAAALAVLKKRRAERTQPENKDSQRG